MRRMKRFSGSTLIIVLFALAVLSLTTVSLAYRVALRSREVRERAVMIQLKHQALSLVSIAVDRLRANTNDYDHRAEDWARYDDLATGLWLDEWYRTHDGQESEFEVACYVIDEDAKLNVMIASGEALEKLGATTQQIDCLLDWMDPDDDVSPEGAEDDYYRDGPSRYGCKDNSLEMLDELLLVRGFSGQDYFGEDHDHDGRLSACEDDGGLQYPSDNADGCLQLGWIDLLTCCGDGRINLNTAPRQVLETLPLSDGAADQIVAYRSFDADSSGELDEHVFRTETDIEQLQGLTTNDIEVLRSVARFTSEHFRVFVELEHLPTGLRYEAQALVRITENGPETIQWRPAK